MSRSGTIVLAAAAGGLGVVSTVLTTEADRPTTYAATGVAALALTLLAGWALVAAGVWATWVHTGSIGPVTTLLALTWWAPVWVATAAREAGPNSLAGLAAAAALAAPFGPALLLHLALVIPTRPVPPGHTRRLLTLVYIVTAVYVLARALIRDPFLDRYCWNDCSTNVFLLHPYPSAARVLEVTWAVVTVAVGLGAAAVVLGRVVRSSQVGRRLDGPVLAPVALAAVTAAAYGALLLARPAEDPQAEAFLTVYVLRGGAYVLVALAVGWTVLRVLRAESALGSLAQAWADATPSPGLQERLATTLGDNTVRVAYRIDPDRGYVDVDGNPWEAPEVPRLLTPIMRTCEEIALVAIDPAVTMTPAVLAGIGEAARMTIDNERLRAGLLAELSDLRASRARIVTVADRTRHRLERDLHDGAQQRLLALGYELRLAGEAAEADHDVAAAAVLERAYGLARSATEALRDLAQGIYPAVLSDNGLDAALRSIAETSSTPLEVGSVPPGRFSPAVERAVYLVVSEAVATGTDRPARVTVRRVADTLVVTVVPVRDDPQDDLVERVAAIGGRVRLREETLWAEVPCG